MKKSKARDHPLLKPSEEPTRLLNTWLHEMGTTTLDSDLSDDSNQSDIDLGEPPAPPTNTPSLVTKSPASAPPPSPPPPPAPAKVSPKVSFTKAPGKSMAPTVPSGNNVQSELYAKIKNPQLKKTNGPKDSNQGKNNPSELQQILSKRADAMLVKR